MKKLLALIAGSWMLVGCGGPDKPVDATAEVRPFMEKVYANWQSMDIAKIAPYYAKDASLVYFDIAPLQYKGWAEYESGFRKASADWKSLQVTFDPGLKASKSGNIAWVTYTLSLVITPKEGEPIKAQARGTDILEKRGENWVIIHEHVSVPMAETAPPPAPQAKAAKPAKATAKKGKRRR